MSVFKLPDLGEGLPEAEIHEWYVREGDSIELDAPLVAMETAKALVDVPSPQSGKIIKLCGKPGDVIKTGAALVEFESEVTQDNGTVVGNIEQSNELIEDNFIIGASQSAIAAGRVSPAVRALARELDVDLNTVTGSGPNQSITRDDVKNAAVPAVQEGFEELHSVRRMMSQNMSQAHSEVVPVTIFDDADIHNWPENEDLTVRLIQAIVHACQQEPALNAWFDGRNISRKQHKQVDLGIAMDTGDALYVPVIRNAGELNAKTLREKINAYKENVRSREVKQDDLQGATITLSNFGNFAGRYASPIVVPPTVAILGVGRLRQAVVANADSQTTEIHPCLPLSLSFDHRAVTGGEATRFLGAVMQDLQR